MSMMPVQYLEALALEQVLGDPDNPNNLLSFRNAIALDEADAFPEEAVCRLSNIGLHQFYVPEQLGGRFHSSETVVALARVLARRNMSVAVSYSTMVWTMLAWIGGTKEQQAKIANSILKSGDFPCLAYSEEHHGADLAANELVASPDGIGGYRLSGEKWPINRATRGSIVILLARTESSHHQRNQSLFFVNKKDIDCRRYYNLPRVKTHGLRGCDISGIGFRDCEVTSDSRIGAEGSGLELALKAFQITRTYCTGLSLGVGDSALRLTTDFAANRRLYGKSVSVLPHAREVLANAYLSQLVGECISIVSARGLHLYTSQYSTWSSIAKVQVTHLVDHSCQQLAGILGARYFFRERHHEGMFQKILRDGAVVSVFDGSSLVCLDSLATLLPSIASARKKTVREDDYQMLYDIRKPLPSLPLQELDLFGRGRDAVTESLPKLIEVLNSIQESALTSAETLKELRIQAHVIEADLIALEQSVLANPTPRGERNSAVQFARAEQFCSLHSAISCLGIWLFNRSNLGQYFANGQWLTAALARRGDAYFKTGSLSPQQTEILVNQLIHQFEKHEMFSLLPWPLAADQLAETLPETESIIQEKNNVEITI